MPIRRGMCGKGLAFSRFGFPTRLIDGEPFYDLEGNLWGWTKDRIDGSNKRPGGKHPILKLDNYCILRGGSYYNGTQGFRAGYRFREWPGGRKSFIGVRLVRTRSS